MEMFSVSCPTQLLRNEKLIFNFISINLHLSGCGWPVATRLGSRALNYGFLSMVSREKHSADVWVQFPEGLISFSRVQPKYQDLQNSPGDSEGANGAPALAGLAA